MCEQMLHVIYDLFMPCPRPVFVSCSDCLVGLCTQCVETCENCKKPLCPDCDIWHAEVCEERKTA